MADGLSLVYLVCFGVGLVTVLLSVISGAGHGALHVGHMHVHAGHGGQGHAGGAAATHGQADTASPFNLLSILVFLTWFGGAGYLLHGPLGVWAGLSLLVALLAGLAAAVVVYQFLARVVAPQSVPLDPDDYRLEGQVGRVSSPILAEGAGEVLYSQGGRRRVIGARSRVGVPIARGTEVVIVEVEHGLAMVEPWEQFVGIRERSQQEEEGR